MESLPKPIVQAKMISAKDGKIYNLNKSETKIGRENVCDILIDSKSVSRIQGIIFQKNSKFYLQDLDSFNGTLINGKHLQDNSAELKHGDTLSKQVFTFHFPNFVKKRPPSSFPLKKNPELELSQRNSRKKSEMRRKELSKFIERSRESKQKEKHNDLDGTLTLPVASNSFHVTVPLPLNDSELENNSKSDFEKPWIADSFEFDSIKDDDDMDNSVRFIDFKNRVRKKKSKRLEDEDFKVQSNLDPHHPDNSPVEEIEVNDEFEGEKLKLEVKKKNVKNESNGLGLVRKSSKRYRRKKKEKGVGNRILNSVDSNSFPLKNEEDNSRKKLRQMESNNMHNIRGEMDVIPSSSSIRKSKSFNIPRNNFQKNLQKGKSNERKENRDAGGNLQDDRFSVLKETVDHETKKTVEDLSQTVLQGKDETSNLQKELKELEFRIQTLEKEKTVPDLRDEIEDEEEEEEEEEELGERETEKRRSLIKKFSMRRGREIPTSNVNENIQQRDFVDTQNEIFDVRNDDDHDFDEINTLYLLANEIKSDLLAGDEEEIDENNRSRTRNRPMITNKSVVKETKRLLKWIRDKQFETNEKTKTFKQKRIRDVEQKGNEERLKEKYNDGVGRFAKHLQNRINSLKIENFELLKTIEQIQIQVENPELYSELQEIIESRNSEISNLREKIGKNLYGKSPQNNMFSLQLKELELVRRENKEWRQRHNVRSLRWGNMKKRLKGFEEREIKMKKSIQRRIGEFNQYVSKKEDVISSLTDNLSKFASGFQSEVGSKKQQSSRLSAANFLIQELRMSSEENSVLTKQISKLKAQLDEKNVENSDLKVEVHNLKDVISYTKGSEVESIRDRLSDLEICCDVKKMMNYRELVERLHLQLRNAHDFIKELEEKIETTRGYEPVEDYTIAFLEMKIQELEGNSKKFDTYKRKRRSSEDIEIERLQSRNKTLQKLIERKTRGKDINSKKRKPPSSIIKELQMTNRQLTEKIFEDDYYNVELENDINIRKKEFREEEYYDKRNEKKEYEDEFYNDNKIENETIGRKKKFSGDEYFQNDFVFQKKKKFSDGEEFFRNDFVNMKKKKFSNVKEKESLRNSLPFDESETRKRTLGKVFATEQNIIKDSILL